LKRSAGRLPVIDPGKCIACGKCAAACTRNAILEPMNTSCAKCVKYCISMEVPCNPEILIFDYSRCDACGACVSACPREALYWVPGDTRPLSVRGKGDA
jgi:Na+-translocating ferredoxin:NAD+ oxidoreductase subunit B